MFHVSLVSSLGSCDLVLLVSSHDLFVTFCSWRGDAGVTLTGMGGGMGVPGSHELAAAMPREYLPLESELQYLRHLEVLQVMVCNVGMRRVSHTCHFLDQWDPTLRYEQQGESWLTHTPILLAPSNREPFPEGSFGQRSSWCLM